MSSEKKPCSVCGRQISVLKNGTLRHHVVPWRSPQTSLPWRDYCYGSGRLPQPTLEVSD